MLLAYGAAAASAPHRYWRILINANGGDTTYTALAEVEFYDDLAGTNALTEGSPTPSFSASHVLGGQPASAAVDNVNTTEWIGDNNNSWPVWWKVDFTAGVEHDIQKFTMTSQQVVGTIRTPTAFELQYSDDGVVWTTKGAPFSSTGWGNIELRTFTP